jgi:hypothetical protein
MKRRNSGLSAREVNDGLISCARAGPRSGGTDGGRVLAIVLPELSLQQRPHADEPCSVWRPPPNRRHANGCDDLSYKVVSARAA